MSSVPWVRAQAAHDAQNTCAASRRRWTDRNVIAAIRAAWADGSRMSYGAMARSDLGLLRAAVRRFGSWEQALSAAGVLSARRDRRVWTRAGVVEAIRQIAREQGDLSWTGVRERDPGLASAACSRRLYGSWANALRAAGMDPAAVRRIRAWSAEAVIEGIRDRHVRGVPLNAGSVENSDAALLSAARRRFGSWTAALEIAGIEPATVVVRRRKAQTQ